MKKHKASHTINQKIVLYLVLLAVFLTGGLLFTEYLYYSNVLEQYAVKDGETWVQKLNDDLTGVYDEALRFARMASANENVEKVVNTDTYSSPVERYRTKRAANDALAKMISNSQYISSIAVVADEHVIVWTANQFYDELSEAFSDTWYQQVIQEKAGENEEIMITRPYEFDTYRAKYEIISVSIPVFGYGISAHDIRIVVSVDTFRVRNILDEASGEFETLAFISDEGKLLYISNEEDAQKLIALWETEADTVKRGDLFFKRETTLTGSICGFYLAPKIAARPFRDVLLLLLIAFFILILMIGMMMPLLLSLTRPVGELVETMEKVSHGDLKAQARVEIGDEFEILAHSLNDMIRELEQHLNESILNEQEKSRLQYEVLAAQINPHFIYNTLNTVIYLTKKNQNEDVIKITNALIDLLQDGVRLGENEMFSTVREEFWVIQNYVLIQNYRYKDIISLSLDCEEELKSREIPSSILQTIVENAIFHGIVPKGEPGSIWVNVIKENDKLTIMVSDNGVGMSEERIADILSGKVNEKQESRNHIGIYNVINRLKILYGDQGSFTIESEPDIGSTFVITIPDKDII